MKKSDLVSIRSFPTVVQAADVRALRQQPHGQATRDFVGGYLGFDDRARLASETLLGALASSNGGAWFLNGVFGSGKSHLLGVVALLCDGVAHDEFAASHPHLSPQLKQFAPRFVVHFSLDDYAAAHFSLEEIFWREAKNEWTRCGFPLDEFVLPQNSSRGETFAVWDELLARQKLNGTVVCIDEMSLFLSGREHRALQNDAAFLQFLAQRARRSQSGSNDTSSTRCGLWVVAALQKTVEEIGDLDAYALAQIRDRFVTLPLSLAHLPSLVERRLVVVQEPEKLVRFCDETYDEIARALAHLDFGRNEWRRLFPFHPTTVALLAAIAARFGSRTRSAVVFCQQIEVESDAQQRVLPTELFDFWESEMPTFPDLKPIVEVWKAWPEVENEIAIDANEAATMRALMKTLLLFATLGRAASVQNLANALLLDARLPDDGNYQYAQMLLEKMRLAGAGLSLERRDGNFADRYGIDGEARAGELARRFTFNALHLLPVGDRRIAQYVLDCCRDEMPLASLSSAPDFELLWLHTPRFVTVELAREIPAVEALANRLAALQQPGTTNDFLLFIVPPLTVFSSSSTRYATGEDAETLANAWRETVDEMLQSLRERGENFDVTRWQNAIVWWIPRAATPSEWEQAREATAQGQLLHDPQLIDNARGRKVLEHLREGLNERENALSRLGARLLREGFFSDGGGAFVEAGELPLGENWASALEAIGEWTLPRVFPRFGEVAPRLRVLTPSNADALCLETLRRPTEAPFFAASLERTVRGIAQPLGTAVEQGGRWKIQTSSTRSEIARAILALVQRGESTSLGALGAHFAKSVWGLNALQTRVVLCALLRGGEVSAFDARGQLLAANEIGLPLSRSVQSLREGRLLDEKIWAQLGKIVTILTGENLGERVFSKQENARTLLQNWRNETSAATELAQARLHQWRRRLGDASLENATDLLSQMAQLLSQASTDSSVESLSRAAQISVEDAAATTANWREVVEKLEKRHAVLWEMHAFLTHPDLVVPPELNDEKNALLTRFDWFLEDETLLEDAARWRIKYSSQYEKWHAAQNDAARFAVYKRLAESDEMRALSLLTNIETRAFPSAAQAQSALQNEIVKGCRRDGRLANEPFCNACRLRLGERVTLRDPREIEAILQNGVGVFRRSLQESEAEGFLKNHGNGAELLRWNDENGDAPQLIALLTPPAIQLLNDAFRPRRRVSRSWQNLELNVQSCRTKREWQTAFTQWLDDGDNLNDNDEIVLKVVPNEP